MSEGKSEQEAEVIVKERLKQNPKRREHYNSEEEYKAEQERFVNAQREVFAKDVKGYHSCWSKNFHKYEGMTDEEKEAEIHKVSFCYENKNIDSKKFREKSNVCFEFYLKKGMSLAEAKEAQRQRCSTFSLEKCIAKYRSRTWKKTI